MFLIMPSTKVRKNAKIRNRYNQVPHLIQDIEWESDTKTTKHNTKERQEFIPFPSGDHKTARHRLDNMSKANPNPQKKYCFGTVSKKSTGGLKIVSKFHKLFPLTEQNVLQSLK